MLTWRLQHGRITAPWRFSQSALFKNLAKSAVTTSGTNHLYSNFQHGMLTQTARTPGLFQTFRIQHFPHSQRREFVPDDKKTDDNMTLSKLIRQYGFVAAIVYAMVSAVVFWSIYFAIRFAGVDANYMLEKLEPVRKLLGLAHHEDKDAQEAQEANSRVPAEVKAWLKRANDVVSPYIDPAVFSVTFVITKILFPLEMAMVFALTRRWALRWRAKHGHPSLNTLYSEHRHRKRKIKTTPVQHSSQ
jgi:hypothetical protein